MGNWRAKVIISVLGGTTESFRLSTHRQEPVSLLWPQYKAGCQSAFHQGRWYRMAHLL